MLMKTIYFLFLFAALHFTVNAQLPSSCDVPDVLRMYYEPDVKSMSLKWLYAIKSPDTAMIDIPQWCQDTIWSGLAAIFNRHDLPSVDSIFNKYCVHAWLDIWHSLIFRQITVDIDTLYDWTHHWRDYEITTGIATLDTLMAKYGFHVAHVYNWSNNPPTISLYTNQYINAMALCDSLVSFEGVLSAEPNGLGGSWTTPSTFDFSDTSGIKYYQVIFSKGGIGGYFWKFSVYPGCSIELLESGFFGGYDSLPAPVNCNILNIPNDVIPNQEMKIHPNPSINFITIESCAFKSNSHLSIYDIGGRKVFNFNITKPSTQLDISHLPGGIYFVKLTNDRNVAVGKIIKE
jgi:hypothetical protein